MRSKSQPPCGLTSFSFGGSFRHSAAPSVGNKADRASVDPFRCLSATSRCGNHLAWAGRLAKAKSLALDAGSFLIQNGYAVCQSETQDAFQRSHIENAIIDLMYAPSQVFIYVSAEGRSVR
jgi:hypothetical protein